MWYCGSAILRETDNWYEVILLSWGVYLYIVYFCWSFLWQHFKMAKERDMHHYYWPLVSTCSINLYKRIWPSSLTSSSETTISMQLMSFISERYKKVTLESDTTHHVGVYPVGITHVPWTTDVLMSFLNILLIVYGGHNSAEEEKPLAFSQCLQKVVWLCWLYINIPEIFLNKLSKKSWLQKLNNFWLSVINICENWLFITKLLTFYHQQQKLTLPRVVRKNRICKEK